jgi:hypothetical protein
MPYSIKSSELASMSESEREQALTEMVYTALHNPNGSKQALQAQIRQLEIRYEMNSDEMRRGFAAGKVRETAEIAKWFFLLATLKMYD